MTSEPTLYDVLDAINALSSGNDRRFEAIDQRFDRLELGIAKKPDMSQIREEMASKQDLIELESRLLTHIDQLATRYQRFDLEILASNRKHRGGRGQHGSLEFKLEGSHLTLSTSARPTESSALYFLDRFRR